MEAPYYETAVLIGGMVLLCGATLWLLPWTDAQRALTLRGVQRAQARAQEGVNEALADSTELAPTS